MFKAIKNDTKTRARTGRLETPHGVVETPSYVIVGTHGAVRALDPGDLAETKTQLVIANTFHLWQMLGEEGLASFPGIHQFMQWQGPVMTDSGGFQVFSLGFLREQGMRRGGGSAGGETTGGKNMVRITPAGVYFHPRAAMNDDDGEEEGGAFEDEEQYLDAELSIRIQEQIGADIIVAFDEPTSPAHDHEYAKQAMERTHAWAARSLEARQSSQLLYGVVQGAAYEDLRTESARVIGGMGFDGFAIGGTYGEGYGGSREQTVAAIGWSVDNLPEDKPRHLFGVGRIQDLFDGVVAGIDTFDCVIPTREARHGRIWTSRGYYDVTRGSLAGSDEPVDELCGCPVCLAGQTTRGQLQELFKQKSPLAARLATIHNIYFFNDLMEKMRQAINDGKFNTFRRDYLKTFEK